MEIRLYTQRVGDQNTERETAMGRRENIQRLLNPQKIVFIGGRDLSKPIEAARMIGFDGEIWVVNPKHPEIGGLPTSPTLAALPGTPDAAYLAVPAETTVEYLTELRELGCGGAVCFAAGFAESGSRDLQDRLREAAGEMAVVGPNCYGVLNYLDRAALWADFHGGRPVDRGAAIISQSGNLSLILTMADRTLPLSYLISNGNQAVLEASDFIDLLIDDPRVPAIGLYVESLFDIQKFWRAGVRALRAGKPIVALKSGVSEVGRQMTLHHTGSSAGDDAYYQTMFDRLGVVRVRSMPEMLETLKMFCTSGPLAGKRLGVLTCSGADSAMAADRATELGFELPPLSSAQRTSLGEYIAGFVNLTNPFDFNTQIWGNSELQVRCFEDMLRGEQYDVVALVHDFPLPQYSDLTNWESICNSFIEAHGKIGKPAVMISNFGKTAPEKVLERLCENGVTPLGSLQDGLAAMRHAAWYGMCRPERLEAADLEEPMQTELARA
jgi:acyl-CoA synthetase (NDP forming)